MTEINYNKNLCSYCRKEISEDDYKNLDMCCKNCYEKKIRQVKQLANKNIGVIQGESGKVIPEDKRSQKIDEEKKRLERLKEKEKKLEK